MLLAAILGALAAGVVWLFAAKIWWFPPGIDAHAAAYDEQFLRTIIICGVVFFLAQAVLAIVLVRYRQRGDQGRARYSHGDRRLEFLWTVTTAIVFLGLALAGTKLWARVHFDEAPADALPIEVTAKQFAWSFRYAGPDGKFGRTALRFINDAAGNPVGLDAADPASRDDIVSATLRVPVNRPVKLILRSRDVIHSFFVRELRLKQDLVPGMDIPLHFQAERTGTFEVPCSELCGLGHSQMRTTMQVMTQPEFDAWLAAREAQKR